MLGSDLEKAGLPAISGPNTLVFRFPAAYNQAREHCQDAGTCRTHRRSAAQGHRPSLEPCGSKRSPTPAASLAMLRLPRSPPSPVRAATTTGTRRRKEPLVKRAMDVLGGQVVRVDEGFGDAAAPTTAPDAPRKRSREPCSRKSARSPA